MRAERLLAIAAWLCGAHARATTFEPLVADWQREWLAARDPIARGRVLIAGSAAFALSLALRIDTREVVQRHAIGVGWSALPVFTLAGWLLYLYELPWILWNWRGDAYLQRYPFEYLIWHIPSVIAYGLMFAMLPVCLALAAGGMRTRGLAATIALGLGLYLALDGWVIPQVRDANLRRYHGERAVSGNLRVETTAGLLRLTRDAEPRRADYARALLRQRSVMPVSLVALGLMGAAAGRNRARTRRAIGGRTVVGSWIAGWAAASALGALRGYYGLYHLPSEPVATYWVPPLVLLTIGVVMWTLANARTERPLPRA